MTDEPVEQSFEIPVKRGCILFLEAVDAKTGKAVPGVSFLCERDDQPESRGTVQSRTGYIDNPVSDANGSLRAVVDPGGGTFTLGLIPESSGYRQNRQRQRIALPPGKTVTVRFELEE